MTTADEAAPRPRPEVVHTTHEYRCRPLAGRDVKIIVTDQIAVVKIELRPGEADEGRMAIDLSDILALNETLIRGSQGMLGAFLPGATERPGLAGSFPGAVDNDGSHFDAYWKGRRDEAEQPILVTREEWRLRHWWCWPFGERERWTRQTG